MKRKFSYKIQFIDILMMLFSFGLAFYDMTVLQQGLRILTNSNATMSSMLALGIATIANLFALSWGMANGRTKAKRVINKSSLIGFVGWLVFGIVYVVIEVVNTEKHNVNIMNQIGQYIILAASYILSGISIQKAARDIWDADSSACRASEAEYKKLVKKIASRETRINYMLTALENYNQNYDILNEQYAKNIEAIDHAESSVINEILGKTLLENPEITPSEAKNVVEQAKKDFLTQKKDKK